MIETLSGLRIEPDGTTTGVAAPSGIALHDWMRREFNGTADFAHYGTSWDHAVCVIVHETGATNGLPINVLATVLVEELIRCDLGLPHPRRDLLLAAMIRDGGEWTTGKVKSLYAGHDFGHMYRATLRSDLGRLHKAGLIVLHDSNGRRFYTAPAQDGGE